MSDKYDEVGLLLLGAAASAIGSGWILAFLMHCCGSAWWSVMAWISGTAVCVFVALAVVGREIQRINRRESPPK